MHMVDQLGRTRLNADQRVSNRAFVKRRDASRSSMLQIGANTHEPSGKLRSSISTYDVGPDCVAQGWRATLVEPMPALFAKLAERYRGRSSVRLVHGAVCETSTARSTAVRI